MLAQWLGLCRRTGRDLASVVQDLKQSIDQKVKRSSAMSISYSGQFEFMERANAV